MCSTSGNENAVLIKEVQCVCVE